MYLKVKGDTNAAYFGLDSIPQQRQTKKMNERIFITYKEKEHIEILTFSFHTHTVNKRKD